MPIEVTPIQKRPDGLSDLERAYLKLVYEDAGMKHGTLNGQIIRAGHNAWMNGYKEAIKALREAVKINDMTKDGIDGINLSIAVLETTFEKYLNKAIEEGVSSGQ